LQCAAWDEDRLPSGFVLDAMTHLPTAANHERVENERRFGYPAAPRQIDRRANGQTLIRHLWRDIPTNVLSIDALWISMWIFGYSRLGGHCSVVFLTDKFRRPPLDGLFPLLPINYRRSPEFSIERPNSCCQMPR